MTLCGDRKKGEDMGDCFKVGRGNMGVFFSKKVFLQDKADQVQIVQGMFCDSLQDLYRFQILSNLLCCCFLLCLTFLLRLSNIRAFFGMLLPGETIHPSGHTALGSQGSRRGGCIAAWLPRRRGSQPQALGACDACDACGAWFGSSREMVSLTVVWSPCMK